MRPNVNIAPNERATVRKYAKDNDLSLPNAYADLIRTALHSEGYDTNYDTEHFDSE